MKSENKILFTNIPKLSQLKYFLALIDFKEKQDSNFLSNYNWQKVKTRRLLENYDDILAAPVEGRISYVHLIFPEEYFEERSIENFMKETQLSLFGPHLLQNDIYLESIFYTLTFKLSSEWNRMKNYFVKGQHFLNSNEALESVQLQLLMTDGCLAFSTSVVKLKLPLICVTDLGVDLKALHKEGFSEVRQKVYILPHLKPATAIKVHLKIPFSCPFKDYTDIRSHWKNVYGYNLPEIEEEMLYIEVIFGWSNFTYTYPIVCVCPYEPIQTRSKNELEIIKEFSEAVKRNFPKICRYPIEVNMNDDNVFRPISKVYLASEVIDKPNLSKLVADNKIIQDYQKQNNNMEYDLSRPNNQPKKYSRSPPLFLPSFGRAPPIITTRPSEENFKCFPIFRSKNKNGFEYQDQRIFKKLKTSPINYSNVKNNNSQKSVESYYTITKPTSKEFKSNEEIEILARSRNLKKVTVSFLSNFCRENDIPVKPKEKKEMLMQKIYDFFTVC